GFGGRSRVVGDDDELRFLFELVQHPDKASDVGVIERRIHLVEQAEWARFGEEDAEQKRQRDQRALATREQMDALCALAARRCVNLDVAVQWELRVLEPEVAFASTEERHEDDAEVLSHL